MQRLKSAWLKSWRAAASAGSGLLLASAFPPLAGSQGAWVAFAPLLFVARFSGPREAFRWGFLSGCAFWLSSLAWLLRLGRTGGPWVAVVPAWIGLSAYCALYTAAFAMTASALMRSDPAPAGDREGNAVWWRDALRGVLLVFALPLSWVGFEYLRSVLFTGFGWNTLGVSQYRNLALIQVAEWGGVYAVSGLVMLMNAAVALTALRMAEWQRRQRRLRPHVELLVTLFVLSVCLAWGLHRRVELGRERAGSAPAFRVAAIQPNIPQNVKWSDEFVDFVYGRMAELTRRVQPMLPDVIVWPETAVPCCARTEPNTRAFVEDLAQGGAPLLVGSMEVEDAGGVERYYNSSMLFLPGRGFAEVYRKRHLVPFGEYVPLDRLLPWLQRFAPLGISCTPGATSTVFRIECASRVGSGEARRVPLASLICFEDTISSLARDAVRAGARLLINQTNDAWFEGSSSAEQHMSHCVFRCVENRVPAVRCANMGVTCFIDRSGMIDRMTLDLLAEGDVDLAEYRVDEVEVPGAEMPLTFYSRYGDFAFAITCAVLSAAVAWVVWRRIRSAATEAAGAGGGMGR
jgi:apolipoprotein N-acyltransferase